MKHPCLFAAVVLISMSTTVYAGPYVRANAGLGFGDASVNTNLGYKENVGWAVVYEGTASVGYRFGRINTEVGMGYMRSGYTTPQKAGGVTGSYYVNHVIVPARMGYVLRDGKCSLMPMVGADIAYSYSARQPRAVYRDPVAGPFPPDVEVVTITGSDLKQNYKHLSLFASAELRMGYRLRPNVTFTYGPRVAMSVNNMRNTKAPMLVGSIDSQRNFVAFFDGGLQWDIAKKASKK